MIYKDGIGKLGGERDKNAHRQRERANGREGEGMSKTTEIRNLSQLFESYLQGFTLPIGFPSLSGSSRLPFALFSHYIYLCSATQRHQNNKPYTIQWQWLKNVYFVSASLVSIDCRANNRRSVCASALCEITIWIRTAFCYDLWFIEWRW